MVQTILQVKWNNVTIVHEDDRFSYNQRLSYVLKGRLEEKGLCKLGNASVENGKMETVVTQILNDRFDVIVLLGSAYIADSLLQTIEKSTSSHNPVLILKENDVPKNFGSVNRLVKMKKAVDVLFISPYEVTIDGFKEQLTHTFLEQLPYNYKVDNPWLYYVYDDAIKCKDDSCDVNNNIIRVLSQTDRNTYYAILAVHAIVTAATKVYKTICNGNELCRVFYEKSWSSDIIDAFRNLEVNFTTDFSWR